MKFDLKDRSCIEAIMKRVETHEAGIPINLRSLDNMLRDIHKAFEDGGDVEARVVEIVTGMVIFHAESSRE